MQNQPIERSKVSAVDTSLANFVPGIVSSIGMFAASESAEAMLMNPSD